MQLKLFDTLIFITFQNMLRLSPLCTWEIFRRHRSQGVMLPNKWNKDSFLYLEVVKPKNYFDNLSSIYPLRDFYKGELPRKIYKDLSILLYEDLKHYRNRLIPLVWDNSSIILTQIEGIDFNSTGPPNKVFLTQDHPFYHHYQSAEGVRIEFTVPTHILEQIIPK